MKISYNWLLEYCRIPQTPEEVASILTGCGLEVESIEKQEQVKGSLNGIVVGEVKSKIKHPNADKLSQTTVDIGTGTLLNIVCGAPNVQEGQKVLVATVGAKLFPSEGEPFEIRKSKIRGEISEGMICAEDEIGLGKSHEGIMVLDSDAVPGTPASNYFSLSSDTIFEIGLTPNRVDAASHFGVARDLVAVLNTLSQSMHYKAELPSVDTFRTGTISRSIEAEVQDTVACPRYSGITITTITVKESPSWLLDKLKSIGVKPVNNVVDITNFVLHECGQPLHAFDADEISGGKIIVKKSEEGTSFKTLDGVDRKLTANDLMICSATEGMCIAGVFGGQKSGVKPETKTVFIESAYFSPSGIRKTSKHHGLKTDAAFRYERGADPEITLYALKRAAMLMTEICGGTICSEIVDVYPKAVIPAKVTFSPDSFAKLSGVILKRNDMKKILSDIGIHVVSETPGEMELSIPAFKPDVSREADVTEEILRIYGYNKIPSVSKPRAPFINFPKPDFEKSKNAVAGFLCSNGFFEIITHSLVSSSKQSSDINSGIRMKNPLSEEMDVLRQGLLNSGLQAIEFNKNRKNTDLKLFEFGKSYHIADLPDGNNQPLKKYNETNHLALFCTGNKFSERWNSPAQRTNFFFLKSYVEGIFSLCGITNIDMKESEFDFLSESLSMSSSGKFLVSFGKVKNSFLKPYDIKGDVYYADFNWDNLLYSMKNAAHEYREVPKFPEVRRDLSMVLERKIKFHELEKLSFDAGQQFLRRMNLFDVYEGEKIDASKKSYAISYFLQDEYKTLTDSEVDGIMATIINSLESKLRAVIRKQ